MASFDEIAGGETIADLEPGIIFIRGSERESIIILFPIFSSGDDAATAERLLAGEDLGDSLDMRVLDLLTDGGLGMGTTLSLESG